MVRGAAEFNTDASLTMQFGVYLVDNDLITPDDFFEAVKLQLRTRPQLGALAIELHKLNVRQVFSLLRKQCDSPTEMFGDLAIQAGYLKAAEVEELVEEQLRRVRPLRDLLVEMGVFTDREATQHYADFRRSMQSIEERFTAAPALA
jgi:hypothetical protein